MSDSQANCCHGESSWLHETLHRYFGFSSFRPGQLEATRAVLQGQDVFIRMATGSGKSLCMFMGPLCKGTEAIGVIISPLNGLMEQQVCIHFFVFYSVRLL